MMLWSLLQGCGWSIVGVSVNSSVEATAFCKIIYGFAAEPLTQKSPVVFAVEVVALQEVEVPWGH